MFLKEKQILNYFKILKIKKNDKLFIHGNSMALFQIYGKDAKVKTYLFWNCLKNYLGSNGTIIVPTFTYSLGKKCIYNKHISKSKVGQFSEDFRKNFSKVRSNDPLFSVSALGGNLNKINNLSYKNSFGKNSIFDYLYFNNVKILCLGCELDVVTFLHYIEQDINVPYREFKYFDTYSKNYSGKIKYERINFFCRIKKRKYKYNLKPLIKEMKKKNKISVTKFGRLRSYIFNSKDLFNICKKMLLKNNEYLIYDI